MVRGAGFEPGSHALHPWREPVHFAANVPWLWLGSGRARRTGLSSKYSETRFTSLIHPKAMELKVLIV